MLESWAARLHAAGGPEARDLMNALQFLNGLRPALPMSAEKPCTVPTNGELRRWMQAGAVLLNGTPLRLHDQVEAAQVTSLVFFPRSPRRTTLY